MDPTIKMINETQLRDCLEHDGVVALVTVDAADIRHAGTRSETVTIKTTVKQTLHGTVGDTLTLQRYTKSGDTVLVVGRMYGVAGGRNPRWAPAFALLDFVEVLPGEENAFVDAQKKAIARLAQKP